MPKPDGITFNRYVAIAGRVLRAALKEDKRAAAQRQDLFEIKGAKWTNGQQGEAKNLAITFGENK